MVEKKEIYGDKKDRNNGMNIQSFYKKKKEKKIVCQGPAVENKKERIESHAQQMNESSTHKKKKEKRREGSLCNSASGLGPNQKPRELEEGKKANCHCVVCCMHSKNMNAT